MVFGKGGKNKKRKLNAVPKKWERKANRRDPKPKDDEKDHTEDDNADPHKATVSSSTEASPVQKKQKKQRATMKEREEMGHYVVDYKQMRTYVIVAYANRWSEPDEEEWGGLARILSAEIGMNTESIKRVFRDCRDRKPNITSNKPGAGRPKKLERDNPGLIAAAIALNTGQSPAMATEVCNAQNKDSGVSVCKNTLLSTLADYTDTECVATLRCKTGKKDDESDWAVARHAQTDQMMEQQHLGALIDTGELEYKECNPDLPPIWDDGTLWVDENHIQQVLPGGTGQDSSFSRQQYRIAIDPKTGKLLPLKQGGKMPRRKFR